MLSHAASQEIEDAIEAILTRHRIPAAVVFAITSVHEPATRIEIALRPDDHLVATYKRNKEKRDSLARISNSRL